MVTKQADPVQRAFVELDRWHRFAEDLARGRARAWLADQGYRPVVPTEPQRD